MRRRYAARDWNNTNLFREVSDLMKKVEKELLHLCGGSCPEIVHKGMFEVGYSGVVSDDFQDGMWQHTEGTVALDVNREFAVNFFETHYETGPESDEYLVYDVDILIHEWPRGHEYYNESGFQPSDFDDGLVGDIVDCFLEHYDIEIEED